MKFLKIRHSAINVKNIETAVMAYEAMGWKVIYRENESWPKKRGQKIIKVAKLLDPSGGILELMEGDIRNHICFEVDEFPPNIKPDKVTETHKVAFVRDENNNQFELYQSLKGEDENG